MANSQKPRAAAIGSLDVATALRYLQTPVDVSLDISFRAETPSGAAILVADDPASAGASPSPNQMDRLRALGPQVMAWLAASDDNRFLFLSDPVTALQKMDPTLDKTFLKDLQQARQANLQTDVDPRVRLAQVRVAVDAPKPAAPSTKTPTA